MILKNNLEKTNKGTYQQLTTEPKHNNGQLQAIYKPRNLKQIQNSQFRENKKRN